MTRVAVRVVGDAGNLRALPAGVGMFLLETVVIHELIDLFSDGRETMSLPSRIGGWGLIK
jgi:hypothetical protein